MGTGAEPLPGKLMLLSEWGSWSFVTRQAPSSGCPHLRRSVGDPSRHAPPSAPARRQCCDYPGLTNEDPGTYPRRESGAVTEPGSPAPQGAGPLGSSFGPWHRAGGFILLCRLPALRSRARSLEARGSVCSAVKRGHGGLCHRESATDPGSKGSSWHSWGSEMDSLSEASRWGLSCPQGTSRPNS